MLLSETCPGIPAMNKALCCNRRKKNRTRSCQHDSEENSFLSEKSNHYCNLKAHAQHATWPSVFVFYPSLLQQSIPEHLLPWATNRHQVSGPHMICIISSHLSKTQHKPWVVTSPNQFWHHAMCQLSWDLWLGLLSKWHGWRSDWGQSKEGESGTRDTRRQQPSEKKVCEEEAWGEAGAGWGKAWRRKRHQRDCTSRQHPVSPIELLQGKGVAADGEVPLYHSLKHRHLQFTLFLPFFPLFLSAGRAEKPTCNLARQAKKQTKKTHHKQRKQQQQ